MLMSRAVDWELEALDTSQRCGPHLEPRGAFADYYRSPDEFATFGVTSDLAPQAVFFRFGDAVGYGRCKEIPAREQRRTAVPDLSEYVNHDDGRVCLPFDLSDVVTNLRCERYHSPLPQGPWHGMYYVLRPLLSVPVRRHLQRLRLSGWDRISFPRWPVDFSVEDLMANAMALQLRASGQRQIPFIWFWPDGAPGCAIMTHDVEGREGRDFCDQLMDLDDSYGITASFQVVPEVRYGVSPAYIDRLCARGFEVNVHDLNHDGRLFRSRKHFLQRVARINDYGRKFRSRGFRAGAMYRQQDWFSALEFGYDMSVPNVAHLEPQRGGCCTVMPYFIGDLLELPLTTVQDYSLFHILNDYSISLWKTQSAAILARNGLISFIAHPDYLTEPRAQAVYKELLAYICELRDEARVWFARPGEVEQWWRNRSRMSLVRSGDRWEIEGPDAHRARVAFATLENDGVVYSF